MFKKMMIFFIHFLSKTLSSTYRYKIYGCEHLEKAKKNAYIQALWHENAFISLCAERNIDNSVIVLSLSKDGNLAYLFLKKLGVGIIRGSSSRGGYKIILQMLSAIKGGKFTTLTIDGPRGPRHTVKKGIFIIAQKSSKPIMAFSAYAKNVWTLKSWDQFKIPKPFSKIAIIYSQPFFVDSHDNLNIASQRLGNALALGYRTAQDKLEKHL